MLVTLLAVGLPGIAAASAKSAQPGFADRSDEELTALAADWDSLDRVQRRALLTEMKLRMARDAKGNGEGVLHIRTERRYGRLIRQSDGRVIRIETQVVHVRPISPEEVSSRRSFGVGFERRVARRQEDSSGDGTGVRPHVPQQEVLTNVLDALEPALEPEPPPLSIYPVADPTR